MPLYERVARLRRMRPFSVIEAHSRADDLAGVTPGGEVVEVDRSVLQRSPQTLDQDVVQTLSPAVYPDPDLAAFARLREGSAGEMAALIGVKYVRATSWDRLLASKRLQRALI